MNKTKVRVKQGMRARFETTMQAFDPKCTISWTGAQTCDVESTKDAAEIGSWQSVEQAIDITQPAQQIPQGVIISKIVPSAPSLLDLLKRAALYPGNSIIELQNGTVSPPYTLHDIGAVYSSVGDYIEIVQMNFAHRCNLDSIRVLALRVTNDPHSNVLHHPVLFKGHAVMNSSASPSTHSITWHL